MSAALPLPGPQKVSCPDGCGKFGRPLKGRNGHIRGCDCRPCTNGRNSKSGKARHRKFARDTGIIVGKFSSSDEERWRDVLRWEIKSGAQVEPVITRFEAARAQSEATRPYGDARPFAMGAVPREKGRPSVVLLDATDWNRYIVPLLEGTGA